MIYVDNASTTRISDIAFKKMLPFLREQYGNPSSQYSLGVKAKRAIELARKQIAIAISAEQSEIIFTSGGSEANSWVFRSVAETCQNESMHIIISAIEHYSVLNACHSLEQSGAEITYLPVDKTGRVSVNSVKMSIKPHTKLVSIMLANNEIGTIQPIAEIGRLLKSESILFHTDAVQAVGHIPVNVSDLQVDFLTASAHKFNGAKGTGILYNRSGLELSPLVSGGDQERRLRGGTENVAGIVAAGFAIEENIGEIADTAKRLNKMIEDTVNGIKEKISAIKVNGTSEYRLPGMVNICFEDISGESLMHLLDLKGVYVSTSSACSSGKEEPSHVLLVLGLTEQEARSAIRISYGKYYDSDEVIKVVTVIHDAYKKIVENR